MTKVQIKPAERDELYEISVFLNDSWKAEYRGIVRDDYLDTMTVDARYKGLSEWFDDEGTGYLTMRCGDMLIGVAVCGKSHTDGYPDDGEIAAIYLHHDYIGKGYGHELFTKVEELLTVKGYSHFVLDVLTENSRAVRFYQNHGYEKTDDRSVKLGEHEYPLMVFRK